MMHHTRSYRLWMQGENYEWFVFLDNTTYDKCVEEINKRQIRFHMIEETATTFMNVNERTIVCD